MNAYDKVLLQKASYDNDLFKKEMVKTFEKLDLEEINRLKYWLIENFYHTHYNELKEVFDT